jgi:hypothetical protein
MSGYRRSNKIKHQRQKASFKVFACRTREGVHEYDHIASGSSSATSIVSCAATTRHSAARALHQPCSAPRLLVTRLHTLYVNLAVRRDYSSPGRTRSTSTSSCTTSTRLHSPGCSDLLRLRCASGCLSTSRGSSCGSSRRLVVDYFASAARPGASACRVARCAARR